MGKRTRKKMNDVDSSADSQEMIADVSRDDATGPQSPQTPAPKVNSGGRAAFWAVIVTVNLAIFVLAGYFITSQFDFMIYKKNDTSEFVKVLDEMDVGSATPQTSGDLKPNNAWMDLRRPHPYCGFKALPMMTGKHSETGTTMFHNDLGFRSPVLGPKIPGVFRIAMVGGSVVWAGTRNEDTIVAKLAKLLEQEGLEVEYVNAGVSSSISNQEVGILVHDLLNLEVDLVISFDGYNDIYHSMYYNGRVGWPPVRWDPVNQKDDALKQTAPAYYEFIPPDQNMSMDKLALVIKNYVGNVVKMAKICKAFDIKFLGVLQPWQGFDDTLCRKKDMTNMEMFYCQAHHSFERFRSQRRDSVAFLSMAGFFAGTKDMFRDPVHFHGPENHDHGNQLVAERLLAALKYNRFLPDAPQKD